MLNVLRNYFVLVSLLCNGAEGVNMYVMLVKVFDSGRSGFVLKACVIAWGKSLPEKGRQYVKIASPPLIPSSNEFLVFS